MIRVIMSRQAGIAIDGRVSVFICRRVISDDWIQITVCVLLIVRMVCGEAISWVRDREIMKDNGWGRN